MRLISLEELNKYGVTMLGLDPTSCDLTTVEAVALALRRAASFLCPCSRKTLKDAVLEPLQGVSDNEEQLEELVDATIEALTAYGDLTEETDIDKAKSESRGTLLNLSLPRFVWRKNRSAFLVGLAPDHYTPLPADMRSRVEVRTHTRRLVEHMDEDLRLKLEELGLSEIRVDDWLQAPGPISFVEHIEWHTKTLIPMTGTLPGIKILDPSRPVKFYPGRWTDVKNQSGRFVARRPQAYGNDIWCYVELDNGRPIKIKDFPSVNSKWRGCDEAWHLQAAIDAKLGSPQLFRVRAGYNRPTEAVDFFSPVPMWARRRWEAVGESSMARGCLFSYIFPLSELDEEISFMKNRLWLVNQPT